jgi:hypothetical protein
MKNILTTLIIFISLSVFGQADTKFDILMRSTDMFENSYTKVIDYDKPDTCFIHVITNDTVAIRTMKNTYLLDSYIVKGNRHTFYFPKKSGARILTNLNGAQVKFHVDKVIVYGKD